MSIHFQFKSCTVMESIPIDGHYISVGDLKDSIIEFKGLKRGNKILASLIVYNHQTKEEYLDDSTLIRRHTTVLIRRVPLYTTFPIIVTPRLAPAEPEEPEVVKIDPEDLEWDELVNVINGKPETLPSQSANAPAPPIETSEDSKINALVQTRAALDWRRQGGGGGGFGQKTPPQGYICHRCKVAGHFIQHCPTNGDPDYDIKRAVAVLRPNEAAFEGAMQGLPSSKSSAGQLPPELHCRLCKQVMKDAVLTSRCCFDSFCDRCIRGHIISKRSCVCGAANVLADHLIPNLTLRNTISRILDSSSSGEGGKQQVVESVSVKESAPAASQETAPLPDEDVQQKPVSDELAVKKKARVPMPVAAHNYAGAYNPHRGGMDAFMPPYNPGFGHGFGPFGDQQVMMHSGMESNAGSSEARKVAGKREREGQPKSS